MTLGWGAVYSYGVFFKPIAADFGWSSAAMSGAYSLFTFVRGLLYIVIGKLNDRFGPRIVMTGCGLGMGLGYLLMSQVGAIWQLYLIYGVIIGTSTSGFFVPIVSTTVKWFVKMRGLMTGIAVAGIGLGTMIMPPLLTWLIPVYGWRTCFVIVGVIILVFVVLAAQFLRPDPAQMGELPYGEEERGLNTNSLNSEVEGYSFRTAFRTRQFWLFTGIMLCFSFSVQTIMVHIVPHASESGVSAAVAASALTVLGATSLIGRIAIGSASDRIGNKKAMVISLIVLLAALFWLLAAKNIWMLYLFAAAFGLAYGGEVSLSSPMVAELFGLSSHGIILGVISFVGSTIGGAIGPLVAGRMFDTMGNYQSAFLICAVMAVIGLILTLLLTPTSGLKKCNGKQRNAELS